VALEDREAIRQLIYYKARATDRADPAAEARAFGGGVPYADRKGPAELLGSAEGRAALIRDKMEGTHHQIGNIIIDLRGNVAFTETYCTAYHRSHPTADSNDFLFGPEVRERLEEDEGRNDLVIGLRYLEKFEKRDGEWRICERRLVYDWSILGKSTGLVADQGLFSNSTLRGARKPNDPSYNDYAIGAVDR
jgi:hypothetical protein